MRISYDARGLAEPVAQAPMVAIVEPGENGLVAVFDAAELTTRQINLELRRLVYDKGEIGRASCRERVFNWV